MIGHANSSGKLIKLTIIVFLCFNILGCNKKINDIRKINEDKWQLSNPDNPEYFLLRPDLEKMYGYTQAVKVGNLVKIGGVISIDEHGKPIGEGDFLQQMKNCYSSIEKVLNHYGCTFDDVILENLYTTSMVELQKNAFYRHEVYKNHFPTGSWLGVKELGLPEMMIEIEIEALVTEKQ